MEAKVTPGPIDGEACVREAVCIHTNKIFDSCRDKDCLEDLRLFFTERDNFNTAHAFAQIQQELFGQIGNWRNRKTKVVGDAECVAAARAYEADVDKWLSAFETAAGNTYQAVAEGIRQKFRDAYEKQGMALDYEPSETQFQPMTACEHVELYYELLDMEIGRAHV